jgi:hypothetical protein
MEASSPLAKIRCAICTMLTSTCCGSLINQYDSLCSSYCGGVLLMYLPSKVAINLQSH